MKFQCNQGATDAEIGALRPELKRFLPEDYLALVRRCNGGEGFVGEDYLVLWRIGDLEQFNREYEVEQYLSDVLLFGSNGGGEAFGFRHSGMQTDIVRVPFIGMDAQTCVQVASTFAEFAAGVGV